MHIGKHILIRDEDQIKEGIVIKILYEDLEIRLEDNTIITRKFWEIHTCQNQ